MIIYNLTTNIDESVHDEWLHWMQHSHIPDVLATGKFSKAHLVKVLVEEEMGGKTYSVQFHTESHDSLKKYYEEDAPKLRDEAIQKFGDKMLTFRTELEFISEHKSV